MEQVYGNQPTTVIIVDQKQGPQGDVTPEALATKEAAEQAAANAKESELRVKESEITAKQSEITARQSELNSKESEIKAGYSAEAAARSAEILAVTSIGAVAPAYDPERVYSYGAEPFIVAYTDGCLYMCIGCDVEGELPDTSPNWKKISMSIDGFFYLDENDYLVPSGVAFDSEVFMLDEENYITFKEV